MTYDSIFIRAAHIDEASELTALTMRSKAHWGYSAEFMEACRDELRIDPEKIFSNQYFCFVAEQADTLLGYYLIKAASLGKYELEALFLEPSAIGQGIGKALLKHAELLAKNEGARILMIESDPNAEAFYISAGAIRKGSIPSASVSGRVLPLLEISL